MHRKAVSVFVAICVAALLGGVESLQAAILDGNYLRVGVSQSGGLIDDAFTVGIDYDVAGTGTWTAWDFLKPGTPFEFYSIGVGGTWARAGYWHGNTFGCVTTDTSSGAMNSATTTGNYGNLAFQQDLWFGDNSGVIYFHVVLTNTSTSDPLEQVVYARGLDPDQDVYAGGGYETDNEIPSGNLVYASAPITDWTIGIYSNSVYPHTPTVDAGWDTNPYNLLVPHHDGDYDWTINMAFNIGTLVAGQSAHLYFEYRIGETREEVAGEIPEPATLVLIGVATAGLAVWRRRR